jgi:hypothetical protein
MTQKADVTRAPLPIFLSEISIQLFSRDASFHLKSEVDRKRQFKKEVNRAVQHGMISIRVPFFAGFSSFLVGDLSG